MLRWFPTSTGAILDEQRQRLISGRPASRSEAAAEIGAMFAAGLLETSTPKGLASTLLWSRGKLRRFVQSWPWEIGGHETEQKLPKWWTHLIEQSREVTPTGEHETDTKRTQDGPSRARSSLKKKREREKTQGEDVQKPETKPKPERAPLPFKVGRSLRDVQLPEALIRFWSAYTAPEGPFPGATLTKAALGHLRAREKDYGADRLIGELIPWLCSDHDRALFLRSRGDVETPLRESNLERYLDLAERHRPAPDVDALIDQLRRSVLTGMTEGLSPELIAAVDSVGGLRVYGRANEREALRLERLIARRLGAA